MILKVTVFKTKIMYEYLRLTGFMAHTLSRDNPNNSDVYLKKQHIHNQSYKQTDI